MKLVIKIFFVLIFFSETSLLLAQSIQKRINGQWMNWCYINGTNIQFLQDNNWITYLQIDGSVIKVLKDNYWVNQFSMDGTTALEALDGQWVKRYYPNGTYIQKAVNGNWHNEWKINGNYIQEWINGGWQNQYFMPDGIQNITVVACALDASKFKLKLNYPPPPANYDTNNSNNSNNNNSSAVDDLISILEDLTKSSSNNQNKNSYPNNQNKNSSAGKVTPAPDNRTQGNYTRPNNNPTTTSGNCRAMDDSNFATALDMIDDKTYDDDKVAIAKQIAKTNCLTAQQIKKIMKTMVYDDGRLEFAKYAYSYSYDPQNYFLVNDAFTYRSNVEELNKYILDL